MPIFRAYPRAVSAPNPLRLAANRGAIPGNTTATAANSLRVENRMAVTFGNADLSEIRLVYHGFFVTSSNVETAVGNTQAVRAWLEYAGRTIAFGFGGATTGTIPSGPIEYVSDPVYAYQFGIPKFPKGMTAFIRDERTVTSGQLFNRFPSVGSLSGEGTYLSDGTATAQGPGTGAMTTPANGSTLSRCFGPSFVLGRAIGLPDIAVLGVGDSIMAGVNDTLQPNGSDGSTGGGFMQRALIAVNGRAVPFLSMALAGTGVNQFSDPAPGGARPSNTAPMRPRTTAPTTISRSVAPRARSWRTGKACGAC